MTERTDSTPAPSSQSPSTSRSPHAAQSSDEHEPHLRSAIAPSCYLTDGVPGVGGRLRVRPEDFLVEEVPAYEPCGQGEHLYLFIEKRDLSTGHMIRLLAEHFGVRRDHIGVAGLKDKRAITRQLVSIHLPGVRDAVDSAKAIPHHSLSVHWADLHTNKLRRGHLRGNRFVIRIRDVDPVKVVHAAKTLRTLAERGVPNRFGPQRFGHLLHNAFIGRALLLHDHQAALRHLLGPSAAMPDAQLEARSAFLNGEHARAFDLLPHAAHTERRVLSALRRGEPPKRAVRAIEPMEHAYFIAAFQSAVFNRVLDRRLADGTIDRLLSGDVAFKHENGGCFIVDDATANDPTLIKRLQRLEISPSGPMWAAGMMTAVEGSATAKTEHEALIQCGVSESDLAEFAAKRGRSAVQGARRPLRVPLTQPDIESGVDEHGTFIKCVFELPRGAFATTVMAEVMKPSRDDSDGLSPVDSEDDTEPE
ncbi:MAG: tRNA pseudouridine(13) synthase TruD [Phycisphaeraceae bacterium]|nr:tRNA pseudouridine(13) synthase TruD [Phycisphaeraceae bacterium]